MATPNDVINAAHEATGWPLVPLWTIATRVDRAGRPEADLLSVYRDHGVVRKGDRNDNFNRASEDLSAYKYVRRGDLVLNKMKTWQGSLAVSDYEGIVSPAYFTCTLDKDVHPRYVHFLLRSSAYVAQYHAASKGIRPNQWDLPYDEFRSLPFLVPPIAEQRRIADFLDDQIARIDNIVEARQQQVHLLASKSRAALDALFQPQASVRTTRLGHFVRRIEQGWSPQCDSFPAGAGEWGVTKVSAVRAGAFVEVENKRLPDDLRPMAEYEIKSGDLLVTRANTPALVGAFAVVPPDVRSRLILCDKIMRIELDKSLIAEYVALLGQTTRVRDRLSGAGTGASQSMVNVRGSDIRDIPFPVRPVAEQVAIVDQRSEQVRASNEATQLLTSQVRALAELKRSLITAAVTGEFDVSSADGSRVPA